MGSYNRTNMPSSIDRYSKGSSTDKNTTIMIESYDKNSTPQILEQDQDAISFKESQLNWQGVPPPRPPAKSQLRRSKN